MSNSTVYGHGGQASRRGSGLVITGSIILGFGLLITLAALLFFISGMTSPDGQQAMSMIFPFLLLAWIAFGAAPWYTGLLLVGIGRRQQRGPARGEVLAWIFGGMVYPAVFLQLGLIIIGVGSVATFIIFTFSIPIFIALSWVGAAMLIWGKPRPAQQVVVPTM